MREEEKVLMNKYQEVCMTHEEYMKAEAAGMLPRFLATVIAGPAKLNQKSEGIFTSDKFLGLLLDYHQSLYMEEYIPGGNPYVARTCLNLFKEMLVISYVPEYVLAKKSYAIVSPTIRPVSIPLSRVKDVAVNVIAGTDGVEHYCMKFEFENGMEYVGELFQATADRITADANWAAEVNAHILKEKCTYGFYTRAKADETADMMLQIVQEYMSQTIDFGVRVNILEALFEETVLPQMKECIYTTEDYFIDVMIENLEHLSFTEVGKDLVFQLKPLIAREQEGEKAIADKENELAKMKRKLWGAAVIKQRRMKKDMEAIRVDIQKKEQEKAQAHQEVRDKVLEILRNGDMLQI